MGRREYFDLFHKLSDGDYALLTSKLKAKSFAKGEVMVQPGQIQKEVYFIKSGVQMSFFDADKVHVMAFTYPPNLCAIPESFLFQAPSTYHLVSLTDSEVDYISGEELLELFDACPQIERLFRRFTEAVLVGVLTRHIELKSLTMQERFQAFCQRSPHLLQLVPHKYIASYLNIDATNFSKLFNSVRI